MNGNPKAKLDPPTASGGNLSRGKFKSFLVLIVGVLIIGLAVIMSLRAWEFNERHPRTDDAVSRANIIGIAPRVSGQITRINVTDNQFVKGGDLLFEIDPADFQLNVDRAKSALDALDQQIEIGKSKVPKRPFGRQRRSGIRLQIRCSVLNPCCLRATPQKNKLTRPARKSPLWTPRSHRQTRNSTRPVSLSAPWPRCKPNGQEPLPLWERPSWSSLIPGSRPHLMAKS
jgi:hypothetical protein